MIFAVLDRQLIQP